MKTAFSFALILGLAFVGTLTLIVLLLRLAPGLMLLDRPNERSLHAHPRRKVGGLAMMIVVLALAMWLDVPSVVIVAAAFLTVISAIDDVRSLPALVRLVSHVGAACVVIIAIPSGNLFLSALAVASIAWMCDLYNFMDGADGLAGGMTVIGFGALALAANLAGSVDLAGWCAVISAAGLAFLFFNFPPAKVFMGDAGSVPLGFLAAALGYVGFSKEVWPFWYPALVFAPFICDASLTLFKRLFRGEPLWIAHREHLYQRLILSGWSHRRLCLVAYVLMFAVSVGAFAALNQPLTVQAAIIAVVVFGLGGIFWVAERYVFSRRMILERK